MNGIGRRDSGMSYNRENVQLYRYSLLNTIFPPGGGGWIIGVGWKGNLSTAVERSDQRGR